MLKWEKKAGFMKQLMTNLKFIIVQKFYFFLNTYNKTLTS